MKTIRQIAGEIGVTKQTVYKRYKGKLHKAVFPYIRVVDGAIYILEQGETIIKRDFSQGSVSTGAHTEYTRDVLILMLQKELDIKNKQIAELTSAIKSQSQGARYKPRNRKVCFSNKPIAATNTSMPIKRLMVNVKAKTL